MGERKTVKKEVSLNAQSIASGDMVAARANFRGKQKQGFFSKYKWLIIGIVVVVVIFTYRKYKKEKLVNPNIKFKDFLINLKKKK